MNLPRNSTLFQEAKVMRALSILLFCLLVSAVPAHAQEESAFAPVQQVQTGAENENTDLEGFGIFGAVLRDVNSGTGTGIGVLYLSEYFGFRVAGGFDTTDLSIGDANVTQIEVDGSSAFALGGIQGLIPTSTLVKPYLAADVFYNRVENDDVLHSVDLAFSFGSYFKVNEQFFLGLQFVSVGFPLWLKVAGDEVDVSGYDLELLNGVLVGFMF